MAEAEYSSIAEYLRRHGARATPARVQVLHLLRTTPAPLSHAEIETQLGGKGALDRVTLYRVLDWLVDRGLAHKNADAGRVFRYSIASPGEHARHIHFRCESCGRVYCLEASLPVVPALPPGFALARMDFDLRGTCARCSANL